MSKRERWEQIEGLAIDKRGPTVGLDLLKKISLVVSSSICCTLCSSASVLLTIADTDAALTLARDAVASLTVT